MKGSYCRFFNRRFTPIGADLWLNVGAHAEALGRGGGEGILDAGFLMGEAEARNGAFDPAGFVIYVPFVAGRSLRGLAPSREAKEIK